MNTSFQKRFVLSNALKELSSRFAYTKLLLFLEFLGFIFLIDTNSSTASGITLQAVLMANFCLIALSVTLQLLADRFNWSRNLKLITYIVAIGVILLATLFFMRGHIESIHNLRWELSGGLYRQWILILVSVLSIFSVPFLRDNDTVQWWNFVFAFFKRGLVSLLYSIAVFIGLALALGALDTLWDFQLLGDNQYVIIWFFAAFIVAPFHLLADLKIDSAAQLQELPGFLFIFAKFILTPLVGIYTLILYPYVFSFPFRSEWPANEATAYILVMLVLGLAEILMLYGVGTDENRKKFATRFTRVFSVVAIPAILFWAYSLYLRIDAYALTVNRFVLLAIIFWFLGVFIYYLAAKVTNAQYVIGSFLALLIVLFYFPFSAFYWGEQAQINRLYDLYVENDLVENGLMIRGDNATEDLNNMIGESFEYLNNYHSLKKLEPKLSSVLANKLEIDDNGYAANLRYRYDSNNPFFASVLENNGYNNNYISVSLAQDDVEIPEGYASVRHVRIYADYSGDKLEVENEDISFNPDINNGGFSYSACAGFENNYSDLCTTDTSLMTVELENSLLIVVDFSGRSSSGGIVTISSLNGYLFTK